MKRILMLVAIVSMCLGSNGFAEESEYKSFDKVTSSSRGYSTYPQQIFGLHVGMGISGYWDYPSNLGENDWLGMALDLGFVLKYQINHLFAVVPEFNFAVSMISRTVGHGSSLYSDYTKKESHTILSVGLPILFRYTPIEYFYAEAGLRLNINFHEQHSFEDVYDDDSFHNSGSSSVDPDWVVNTFVPALVLGVGGIIKTQSKEIELGVRFVLDVRRMEQGYREGSNYYEEGTVVDSHNPTKIFAVQFVFGYYFI